MTRNRYEQQLADIKSRTTNLGNNAERLVELSVKALKGQDAELAQQVINMDNDLDHDYLKLEERIMRVIAMQAPVAGDLRMLLTALKNATDIERLGDYAKDIAEITIALKDRPYFTPLINIPRMAEIAIEMVRMSLDAFEREDAALAGEVYPRDDEVDALFSRTFRTLSTYVFENPGNIEQAFNLMLVARHLERVADHALNIANRTIYMEKGDITFI